MGLNRETIDNLIDGVGEVLARLLFRLGPIFLTIGATVAVARGYAHGKIPLEGAATQLAIVYSTCGSLYGIKLMLDAKAATMAADRRAGDTPPPGTPNIVASQVVQLKAAARETGETPTRGSQ